MGQDFVAYLPSEIVMDILLRLPCQSIMRFRCVSKFWLRFTETHEFIKFYFQKSSFPGGLALFQDETSSKPLKILEFDEGNSTYSCGVVLSISFPIPHHELKIHSSVNGLLFLFNCNKSPHFICNPITREYIELPPQKEAFSFDNYGFGISKQTGQYKVVRMFSERDDSPIKCEVYTVGTRSWRSIAADVPRRYAWVSLGVFFNGNLHWLERESCLTILCFDLETERFSTFFAPPLIRTYNGNSCGGSLHALGDCLYFFQNSFGIIVICLMNENGDHKSWRVEFVIKMQRHTRVVPIKIFRDGDILFTHEYSAKVIYCYSSKTKTIREITRPELVGRTSSRVVSYTPNFSPLKTFALENVSSF